MNQTQDITARLQSLTLSHGGHETCEDGMCAMEAVSYLLDHEHGDRDESVCPVIGALVRRWNDSLRTNEERDRLLKPLLTLLIDTRGNAATRVQRTWVAIDWIIRTYTPAFMRLSPPLVEHATNLESLPVMTVDTIGVAAPVMDAALDAALGAALDAALGAVRDAARDAALGAVRDAARDAALGAVRDAARAALGSTVVELQSSAQDLIRRMCEVGRG